MKTKSSLIFYVLLTFLGLILFSPYSFASFSGGSTSKPAVPDEPGGNGTMNCVPGTSCTAPAPTPPPPPPPPTPTIDPTSSICASQPIPAGWVVDQVVPATSVEPQCGGYEQYGIIELSSSNTVEAICGVNQALPTDWVITQIEPGSTTGICANDQSETIQNVLTTTVGSVCSSYSPLPQGWIINGVSPAPSSNCAEYQNYSVAKVTGSQEAICSISPVPANWVVTQVGQFGGGCAQFLPETISLATGTQMGLCYTNTPIPAGWYISENSVYGGSCGIYLNSIMTKVNSYTTELYMCDNSSPAPVGWTFSSMQPSSTCYPYEVEILTQ